ncbi:FMN-binding negative transcriptional regulator [Bradyrhizobium yuanmingense]|uniref:FMN-binding negative transcriptional regulator n=1 Tax=Bradyrhizobium yuanmingense TaxID=108015 RepID=UPI003517DBAB
MLPDITEQTTAGAAVDQPYRRCHDVPHHGGGSVYCPVDKDAGQAAGEVNLAIRNRALPDRTALAIFTGAEACETPSWSPSKPQAEHMVPTWNLHGGPRQWAD